MIDLIAIVQNKFMQLLKIKIIFKINGKRK